MTRLTTRLASLASVAALAGSLAYAQQTPPPAPGQPTPDQNSQGPRPGGRMQGGPGGPMGQGMHQRDSRGGGDNHEGRGWCMPWPIGPPGPPCILPPGRGPWEF